MSSKIWTALTRRKRNDESGDMVSDLKRCLTLVDLTALGVGSTLGLGVYVLAGSVAHDQAGPAVTISFLIAAIASAFAGFCYAEFAARVPKAGSAYVYSYVSVGEFVAFTIGWNLILEYVIGTSSVARGLSGYLDSLIDNKMSSYFRELMPIDVSFLAKYPDFFSFFIVLLLAVLLAVGVKESSMLNNIFTTVNLITVIIMFISGCIKADPDNWKIAQEKVPDPKYGTGGFMPYGIAGVMAGAAKCFYGFVGFDCVATTGEEAQNPQRNIPLAIVISLIIIFLAYFGISTVLTMMAPYFLLDVEAPFPKIYQEFGWTEVRWIVSIGAIFALCTSLLGAMFPLPRVLYAMGSDGIIFRFLSKVSQKTKTPLLATILSGILAAFMALIFDLHQLIDMMSIGTLLAYTIVAICVLVLRYQEDEPTQFGGNSFGLEFDWRFIKQIFNLNFIKEPNSLSSHISKIGIVLFCILSVVLCSFMKMVNDKMFDNVGYIIIFTVIIAGLLLSTLSIARQPMSPLKLHFKVPLVPYLPVLSILINLYLMYQLDVFTWIRFAVWLFIGYVIYFVYGIRHSSERKSSKVDAAEKPTTNGEFRESYKMTSSAM